MQSGSNTIENSDRTCCCFVYLSLIKTRFSDEYKHEALRPLRKKKHSKNNHTVSNPTFTGKQIEEVVNRLTLTS